MQFGVCFSPQKNPHVEIRILREGQLKIYLRKGHPLLRQAKPLPQLNSYAAVLPKAFVGIDVCESHPTFDSHGIRPRSSFAIDSYDVAMQLVKQSDDWGFFPEEVAARAGSSLVALPLPRTWQAPYNISAVWAKERRLDSGLTKLLKLLLDASSSPTKSPARRPGPAAKH